jgi:hypothetical protein
MYVYPQCKFLRIEDHSLRLFLDKSSLFTFANLCMIKICRNWSCVRCWLALVSELPINEQEGADKLVKEISRLGGRLSSLKIFASPFNKDLLSETTFSQIHLYGQCL